ncbi:MAG: zinc ribbon domain-containing protein [Oscillospiraceae bacterium]|jgi:hypothetical protein|nr:zinc ribbon domain-containing protein [Oscillospiraceae bacterium]
MICPNCGAQLPQNAKFCGGCGTPVKEEQPRAAQDPYDGGRTAIDAPEGGDTVVYEGRQPSVTPGARVPPPPAAPDPVPGDAGAWGDGDGGRAPYAPDSAYTGATYGQEAKKKLPLPPKKLTIIAGCAAAAIIAAIVLVSLFKPSKYTKTKSVAIIAQSADEVVFITKSGAKAAFDGIYEQASLSMDGTKTAFLIADEDYEEYTLYYSDGGTPKRAAYGDNMRFSLAASGKAAAYLTWDDGDDSYTDCTLYIYTGGKSTKIASGVHSYNFCISPDGKTVAYVAKYDSDDGDFVAYIWDGKSSEVGKNKAPVAVSDGGRYFYYRNKDGTLYVQKGARDDTKQRLGDGRVGAFNRDLSQVIFDNGDKSYISVKGGERRGLLGGYYRLIVPYGTQQAYSSGIIYGVSSFANSFYESGNGNIVRITGKFAAESVVKSISGGSPYLADDGKTLLYIKNDDVYKINGMRPGAEATKLASDVEGFIPTSKGDAIYYGDDDEEVFYQKGLAKPKSLGDAESVASGLFEGKTLFFVEDGELRSATGEKVTSSGFKGIDEDVSYVGASVFHVSVTDEENVKYVSFDGKKFEVYAE